MRTIKAAALLGALVFCMGAFSACKAGTPATEITAETDPATISSQQLSSEEWLQAFGAMPAVNRNIRSLFDKSFSMRVETSYAAAVRTQTERGGASFSENMTVSDTNTILERASGGILYFSETDRPVRSVLSDGQTTESAERNRTQAYYVTQHNGQFGEAVYGRNNPDNAGWTRWSASVYDEQALKSTLSLQKNARFPLFGLEDYGSAFSYERSGKRYAANETGLRTLTNAMRSAFEADLLDRVETAYQTAGGSLVVESDGLSFDEVALKFSGGMVCWLHYSVSGSLSFTYTDASAWSVTNVIVDVTSFEGTLFCYNVGRTEIDILEELSNGTNDNE